MTPIADMVEKMATDGVPMATILLAVRTAELAASRGNSGGIPVDKTAEKRRAYDRERKAKNKNSGGIPVDFPPETEIPSLSKSSQKEVFEEGSKRESPPKRGERIPPDWQPNEHDIEAALKRGISRERIPTVAEKFRNHWLTKTGNKTTSTNWHLNWCTWCINEAEWSGNGQARGSGGANPGAGKRTFSAIALERARAAGINN